MQPAYVAISGASSPIGMAIAKRLAPRRPLILHGRNHEKLTQLRDACANQHDHLLWECDLIRTETIEDSLQALFEDRDITVDTFVHCAGSLQLGAFRLMPQQTEADLFAVNVFAAIEIVRVLRQEFSSLNNVVFISSGASLFGVKGNATYCATKGALDAFMKSLAIEMAPDGRANSILPGMVEGGMSDLSRENAAYEEVIKVNYPLGLGRTADIAAGVDFLISDQSRWITGQQILVDGGYSAHSNHAI